MISKNSNKKGFTLIETMIGLMILTMAIVSATSMLMGLINSNKLVVQNLQAYYLAQEGLEGIRNIRDTNWMHNIAWKGESDQSKQLYPELTYNPEDGSAKSYTISLDGMGWQYVGGNLVSGNISSLQKPWVLKECSGNDCQDASKLYLCGNGEGRFYSNVCSDMTQAVDAGFNRHVEILKPAYCLLQADGSVPLKDQSLCDKNAILVRSVVESGKSKIVLEEVLTNWKGGAL